MYIEYLMPKFDSLLWHDASTFLYSKIIYAKCPYQSQKVRKRKG